VLQNLENEGQERRTRNSARPTEDGPSRSASFLKLFDLSLSERVIGERTCAGLRKPATTRAHPGSGEGNIAA
jgi:hypothetical protein